MKTSLLKGGPKMSFSFPSLLRMVTRPKTPLSMIKFSNGSGSRASSEFNHGHNSLSTAPTVVGVSCPLLDTSNGRSNTFVVKMYAVG